MNLSSLMLVLEVLYIMIYFFSLPPFIPVFNQMPWGEERLGGRVEIFLPVGIAGVFILLNIILISRLYEKSPLVARMLGITTLMIGVLSVIFVVRTLHLII